MVADLDRETLLKEIESLSREIAGEFQDAIRPLAHVQLAPGVRCPDRRRVPVRVLRRLHGAVTEFMAEAQAAENAKRLRRSLDGEA
jgi:hypothetical protein